MTIERAQENLSQVTSLLADGSYTGRPFAEAVQRLLGASVQIARRHELHAFVVIP
jgi:transposase